MSFHCNTCAIEFSDRDAMIRHYDSALHNDNVKRRVAGLVPLTATAHSVRSSRAATSVASTSYKCTVCDKKFGTAQTLSSHLQSQKHKDKKARKKAEKEASEAGETVEESYDELQQEETWESGAPRIHPNDDLSNTDCLFCNIHAPTTEDVLCHMAKKHNFTIPLADEVIDYPGLLDYLATKVNGCLCLVCNDDSKHFETREGVQNHMAALGHQMIVLKDGEYAEFYKNLDIFTSDRAPAGSAAQGEKLVLPSGHTLVSKHEYKNHQAPVQIAHPDDEETKEKLMITMQEKAHMTTVQMNRYKALLAVRERISGPKLKQEERQYTREQQKQSMRLGVHLNCLHGKGYQGDYVGKTI
eukprot:TRINITY_DN43716_c0_g1_i1.p1 TRINITY_DN43716_c0_g1~~TRINITY_DN43716_c0_g1_i1.p1  ORF type:complete len:377 (+),score=101.13 TRINITY_DN43716_c0_g1_i1:64-1131(+)